MRKLLVVAPAVFLSMVMSGFCAWAQAGHPGDKESPEAETVLLDRLIVTGTRIERNGRDHLLPVTVIDREQIEQSGEFSAAELLRKLNFNSFGSFRPQFATAVMGSSQVDLRGIGPGRSLVLVDGRRLPVSPITTEFQDLSLLPLGNIERIEILTDGASAIYGADAIGGVINVITRGGFRGVQLEVGKAGLDLDGGDRQTGTLMAGTSGESWRLSTMLSWNEREIVFNRDLPWVEMGGSIISNNFTTINPVNGRDRFNFTAIPGGCVGEGYRLQPSQGSLSGDVCRFDVNLFTADEASSQNKGLTLKFDHDLGDDWRLWLDAHMANADSFGRWPPLATASISFGVPIPPDSLNNPTNPASPAWDPAFGDNVPVNWWHRFTSLGPRNRNQDSELRDFRAGMSGTLGGLGLQFGLRHSRDDVSDVTHNLLDGPLISQLIADDEYSIVNPDSNPPQVLEVFRQNYLERFGIEREEVFATIGGESAKLGGGEISWVAGFDFGEERVEIFETLARELHYGARRQVRSQFFEVLLPFHDDFEFSLAGRRDDYSDYGGDFSPKLSMRWRFHDHWLVRASTGEGFRAPQMKIAAEPDTSFVTFVFDDPASCNALGLGEECLISAVQEPTNSTALDSEKSDQLSLGLVFEPSPAFRASVDYYDIQIDGVLKLFALGETLARELADDPLPPGIGVTRDPVNGLILSVQTGWGNEGDLDTAGFDVDLRSDKEAGPGQWQSRLRYSQVLDYTINNGRDRVGDPGRPKARASWSNRYLHGAWTLGWTMHYIADQFNRVIDGVGQGHVPSWVTHDLQLAWDAPWDGQVTLGVQNVFEKEPPLFVGNLDAAEFDMNLYDGYGRIMYARYRHQF